MTVAARLAALAYYRDLARLNRQISVFLVQLWRAVDRGDISGSWLARLPEASAVVVAGQTVAAELADPYLTAVLDTDDARARVNVEAFAAVTPGGGSVESLLYLPTIDAKQRLLAGTSPAQALQEAQSSLLRYAQTTVADAGRLAVSSGMAARPHATGFYRMLQPPSCARCVILAGKFFRYNRGFRRHDRCDCVHVPVQEADDSLLFDARKAIEAGKVTGLSTEARRAIVEFGADPSQVVNAQRGTYLAGGRQFTTTGTTRGGIAGARILARDVDRALGKPTTGTYANYTFDRLKAAQHAELLRKGKTYTRQTKSGRTQSYAYSYARTARPTPEQILADAGSRDDAIRLLTNYGYVL